GGADAAGDLRPRVEHAANALQVALDGMVGDGNQHAAYSHSQARASALITYSNRRCSSPTTGDSGRSATRRIASSTPGMKLVRSVETWRIVSVWARETSRAHTSRL